MTTPPLIDPRFAGLAGRMDVRMFSSDVLRDNPLGDPHVRPLWTYLPPGYDDDTDRRWPVVHVILGYTGTVEMWANRSAWVPTLPEALDAMFAAGEAPGCIVVFSDSWTAFGGSQYVDSPGTGRYHSYLCDEVVPYVDREFRTLADPAHRGIAGKSSGGFGAMITPMLRPDLFGGLATHAGDGLYELCYVKEFGDAVRALRDDYDGSYERFWADFRSRPAGSKPSDAVLTIVYGCAAAFSANPDGSVELPFDVATGRLRDEVWARWLEWDPVRMAERHADTLRGLKAIWIDAGKRDEWYLDLAATAFRQELDRLGVTGYRFELFDAGHGGINYRYPLALRFLAERLAPDAGGAR